ncbi:5-oxoprolinase subunit PxpB [Ferrimonas pelagia]|uniref:5-oxoprolinase subunit PxpB n=1 Tax=Ferrimonas pelagia TaxID=1177826 RepID=A0ABP9EWZ8_9GAMM
MSLPFTIEPLTETALVLRWPAQICPVTQAQIHAIAALLRQWPGLQECVPTYHCLAVYSDPARPPLHAPMLAQWLRQKEKLWRKPRVEHGRLRTLPVCYELGDDLIEVASHCELPPEEVVARHCQPTYRVCFLGFSPGFAYLSGLDPTLATPRRAQPRTEIPAGAVAIGGAQTGLYPSATPGGWQIIGRSPQPLLDLSQSPPTWLQAGDRLKFEAISPAQYAQLQEASPCWT